jgi:predicted nucleic acid-binding OB-fold protein
MAHFGDNIISFFKQAAVKLEELQVQSALGKAELEDKFEEIKKETREQYQHIKSEVNTTLQNSEEWNTLKAKLEHLEVQLALGKAETKDMLEEQKKNLSKAFQEVKDMIKND